MTNFAYISKNIAIDSEYSAALGAQSALEALVLSFESSRSD